jgi:hypothetical protein
MLCPDICDFSLFFSACCAYALDHEEHAQFALEIMKSTLSMRSRSLSPCSACAENMKQMLSMTKNIKRKLKVRLKPFRAS